MKEKSIGVTIIGGTGYGAGELLRLLTNHQEVEVVEVVSKSASGKPIADTHPHLLGFYNDLKFSPSFTPNLLSTFKHRFIFLAIPHDAAGEMMIELNEACIDHQIKVIDLSGAHRLKDSALHKKHYPSVERSDDIANEFIYGITECFNEEIPEAMYIANPGCLATACILSVAPIASLLKPVALAFDTKTGSSGSGRELKATTHHPTRHGNYLAYKPLSHQHEPEIFQALKAVGLKDCTSTFAAQSIPISRGIYVTTHIVNKEPISESTLQEAFESFAERSPFIRLRPKPPEIGHVASTNCCDISFAVRANTILVMTAIDNLVKGMTGQGIQNMNLMAGLPQEFGIHTPGIRP